VCNNVVYIVFFDRYFHYKALVYQNSYFIKIKDFVGRCCLITMFFKLLMTNVLELITNNVFGDFIA